MVRLYLTMGKTEEKTSRKRRDEGANKGRFAGRMIFIIPFAFALLLVLVGMMYYTPLSIWYREARQLRVLTEQKQAIELYNADLRESMLSLETTEGIAVFAREELGLVEEGENAVVVVKDGKPLEKTHDTRQSEILAIPLEWQPFGVWTPFLDRLFQVELPSQ